MSLVYCPYTGRELDILDTNSEHIIPLSLGGINGLEIPVCKKKNSQLGSAIDGKIASELIVEAARSKYGTRSQSGKAPDLRFKYAKDLKTELPIQVTFTKNEGVIVYAPYVPDAKNPPTGETVQVTRTSQIDIWIKYVAKTFLSAGYYAYGEDFKNHVDTKTLRIIMDSSHEELKTIHFETIADVQAHYIYLEDNTEHLKMFRTLCELLEGASCICLIPDSEGFTCFTSILGLYIGTLRVKTDGFAFPYNGHYQMGHFICVQNKKIIRKSFYSVLKQLEASLNK